MNRKKKKKKKNGISSLEEEELFQDFRGGNSVKIDLLTSEMVRFQRKQLCLNCSASLLKTGYTLNGKRLLP